MYDFDLAWPWVIGMSGLEIGLWRVLAMLLTVDVWLGWDKSGLVECVCLFCSIFVSVFDFDNLLFCYSG